MCWFISLFFLTDPFAAAAWCQTLTVDYILFYIILSPNYIILYPYYIYIYMHIYIYTHVTVCHIFGYHPNASIYLGFMQVYTIPQIFLGGNLTCQSNFLAGVPLALRPAIHGATETISG
jgi:hypothetical protein